LLDSIQGENLGPKVIHDRGAIAFDGDRRVRVRQLEIPPLAEFITITLPNRFEANPHAIVRRIGERVVRVADDAVLAPETEGISNIAPKGGPPLQVDQSLDPLLS
jgi:hypothetical protein